MCDFHPDRDVYDCHGGELFLCVECWPKWYGAWYAGMTEDQFFNAMEIMYGRLQRIGSR